MSDVSRLQEIVTRLRAPDGCPWDREQTHSSLRSSLVEECYEVVEAINREDDPNLQEELGDILLHVVMHSHLANEREAFTFEQVVETVCEKLIRRHPHVFGDTSAEDSQQVLKQWEQIKRQEKGGDASILAGLPAALPALMRAQNAQKKAARVGFDWESAAPVYEKIEEEMAEVREAVAQGDAQAVEEEIGDLLFSVVNLARKLKVDSETALTSATGKFVTRFQAVEAALAQTGRKIEEATPEEMNQLWDEHKRAVSAQ